MAKSYHQSAMEVARALDIELRTLEDWNCCGATTYFHIDELLAHTLCARNLAIAEQAGLDLVAPCSGCFKNLYFTNAHLKQDRELFEHINFALQEDNLEFSGTIRVRHLIEVLVQDGGIAEIKKRVTHPLKGLRVAPYYGCQLLRPRKDSEEVEQPAFFEELLSAIGAVPVEFPEKLRCCGGSLIVTGRKAALGMLRELLQSAQAEQARVIATICPMCQINLECYQNQVNGEWDTQFEIPVLYFTQLVGLAFGISAERLGIGKEIVPAAPVLACVRGELVTAQR
jgi:heterodisulfide reductase subunit B